LFLHIPDPVQGKLAGWLKSLVAAPPAHLSSSLSSLTPHSIAPPHQLASHLTNFFHIRTSLTCRHKGLRTISAIRMAHFGPQGGSGRSSWRQTWKISAQDRLLSSITLLQSIFLMIRAKEMKANICAGDRWKPGPRIRSGIRAGSGIRHTVLTVV